MREVIIGKNDAGQRLDKFLTKYLTIPESMLYKSLRKNCVRINGKHEREGARKLCEGDTLNLYLKDEFFSGTKNEDFTRIEPQIDIVFEDENLLLVDKKPGLVVHEDEEGGISLIDHIKSYLYRSGEYCPDEENSFAPALCNRIDRNTGGIVIAAKNAEALRVMNQKIKDRELLKLYLCLLTGMPKKEEGELFGYIFKDEKKKRVYVYDTPKTGAKTAITRYRVLSEKDGLALTEAELVTGRTHQIRAQFAAEGCPLLGDGKYGKNEINKRYGMFYQALYSYKLIFKFTTDAGCLEALNGREFCVKQVDFVRRFYDGDWKN